MGGLGKTTIAKKVYHHDSVQRHFDALAWVCISQKWQTTDILQGILIKLIPQERDRIMTLREEELMKQLYEVQLSKKCLVVLDDIWSVDVWDILGAAFPNTEMGSKILLTTRNKDVAVYKDPSCFLHEPRCLTEEESWELFQRKAFPKQKGLRVDTDINKLGREMVGHCGGLPLAIVALGGILVTKCTLSEWKKVHQTVHDYLRRGKSHGQHHISVYEVLALSYKDLPYQLKPCFLYLGNFAEDSMIPTRKIYQMWAAEGFLPIGSYEGGQEEILMDVAERYLGELVQRCMVQVQVVQVGELGGSFSSCQLHDLMRDMCLSKGKEENFLKVLPLWQEHKPVNSMSLSSTTSATRRLSVHVDLDLESYFPPKHNSSKPVRSLFLLSKYHTSILEVSLNSIFHDFKLLRVLDLQRQHFTGGEVPKSLGNLVHLRYLRFFYCKFKKFPSTIKNLRNLQTLDLRMDYNETLPNVLWKLANLSYLYLPFTMSKQCKLSLGSCSKLEILANFDSDLSHFTDLFRLTNLLQLKARLSMGFKDLEATISCLVISSNRLRKSSFHIEYNFDSDEEVCLLGKLLECHHLCKLSLYGRISKLPEEHHFSQSLTSLFLSRCELKENSMTTLENLPKLIQLSLYLDAFIGKEISCSSGGLPQLKNLELNGLSNLEEWRSDEGAMPNLQDLKILDCKKLGTVPDGLKFCTNLEEFRIFNMPATFTNRLTGLNNGGGQDYYKVQHVSHIYVL